ncbi:DUF4296 domain-containing protein [Pedobacter nutrimenti]|uniref:DUF4296 domain-containing protein n=1 Tax=Pedobacter nutrimenti TaxID=1241337 RepID=UPI00292D6189|nr:DUF4296 domain-containing protein [Pedobacter nutrimenti]
MKKILLAGIASLFLFGCKPPVPKDIIQPDDMGKILYDIHIADGYVNTIPLPDSAKKVASSFYKGIYKKYGTDSAAYTKSMNFYYTHPDLMSSIYEKIKADLTAAKKKVDKVVVDSVAAANKKLQKKLKLDAAKKAAVPDPKLIKNIKTKDSLLVKKDSALVKPKKKIRKKKLKKVQIQTTQK